ncbi:hypothetical protein F7734_49310 [Scytonema sp. UIC 10036]|uniref:hypothetical protein n=1 Tax=Scytonema sp. UIC 10036 TaxID=2304196 RepID=UPI0012DA5E8F|nr:hypothetical protein [Scytonema sp. UIC 10036]MUG99855.1 hypothetical protein [Scytonema sp. UIC 10036]
MIRKKAQVLLYVVGLTMTSIIGTAKIGLTEERTFSEPIVRGGPVEVARKGENGNDVDAQQRGANAYCKYVGYRYALDFEIKSLGSETGAWQWDVAAKKWWYCPTCGLALNNVLCKK